MSRGWVVTLAGTGINLALGILYTWSVVRGAIPKEWGWTDLEKQLPYAIACLVFSIMMVPAGRLQDKISPRWVASIGGLLVGIGMILASVGGDSNLYYILGFGVLAGTGIGFGYASATPPAVKWFPARRTGLIAGIVVSGFGLASVWAAKVTDLLTKSEGGVPRTMMILGVAFLIAVVLLAQLLRTPPKGYVPPGSPPPGAATAAKKEDFSPLEILRTWQFYLMWFMYACGAGAGLVSDRLGRKPTIIGCLLFQAVLMVVLTMATAGSAFATMSAMAVLSALIGANYGANLALYPSMTKDFFGLKNFGVNYGLVFTAWGVGGFVLPLLAGRLYDQYAVYTYSCYVAAGLLVLAAVVALLLRPPQAQRTQES